MSPAEFQSRREALGLSRTDFAALYNINEDTVRKWEKGQSRPGEWVENAIVELEAKAILAESDVLGEVALSVLEGEGEVVLLLPKGDIQVEGWIIPGALYRAAARRASRQSPIPVNFGWKDPLSEG